MADHNATDAVSRRNVLKTAGGLLAGSTMLAGRSAAATEEGLQMDVREVTEEYIAVEVYVPMPVGVHPHPFFLGPADRFIIHEDEEAVSLPEDTEGLASPVHAEAMGGGETNWMTYFRTGDIDFSEIEGEVSLGLGVFPERTMPSKYFDSSTGVSR